MKRLVAIRLVMTMVVGLCLGCGKSKQSEDSDNDINPKLNTQEKVKLVIAGPWEQFKAIEDIIVLFEKKYPNCSVEYEYIQNYEEQIPKRLADSDDSIDIFLSNSIQADSKVYPYALELFSHDDMLDLSNTFPGLIQNYTFMEEDKGTSAENSAKIYAIPLGAELRGMYVNTTLLNTLGISVPKSLSEFMDACEKLQAAGYVPIYGNPGNFAQHYLYPYVCNIVANNANYNAIYNRISNAEPGISKEFEAPMRLMYDLCQKDYYKYKYVETEKKMCLDMSTEGKSMDFLNIITEDNNTYKKDDIGQIPFMCDTMQIQNTIDKFKADYHSEIEYEFILSPVTEEGGFAYMSPARGIAVNKNGRSIDWSLEFLDFLFKPDNNKIFAEAFGITPNTKDAFETVTKKFDLPSNRVSHLGQVTFNYAFYNVITDSLMEVSKSNNPKYMNTDENGNKVMYSFEYYMGRLEDRFANYRK